MPLTVKPAVACTAKALSMVSEPNIPWPEPLMICVSGPLRISAPVVLVWAAELATLPNTEILRVFAARVPAVSARSRLIVQLVPARITVPLVAVLLTSTLLNTGDADPDRVWLPALPINRVVFNPGL